MQKHLAMTNTGLYSGFTGTGVGGPFTFTLPTAANAFGLPRTFFPSRQFQPSVKFDF
jgi:hypothetical protein